MLVSRGEAGKDTERKDREPYSAAITVLGKTEYWSLIPPADTLPNISCLICFKTFNFCSANKLKFKVARVQEHLGVGVWGTFIPVFPDGKKVDCSQSSIFLSVRSSRSRATHLS